MRRAALVLVGAVVVAACAADHDDSAPSTTVAPATSASSTAVDTTTEPTVDTTTEPTVDPTVEPTTEPTEPTEPPTTKAEPTTTVTPGREVVAPGPATLAAATCPPDFPATARCSTLTVLADHAEPEGDTIALPVTVLPATGPTPAPDPIVIPAGGPGGSGSDDLGWAGSPWNERRDIVLYDQRGTGGAVPSLECPGYDAAFVDALQDAQPYTVERDAMVGALQACLADLTAAGVDLTDYHSEASAADLAALRTALGYDEWNIMGVSYGGRLALATMRSQPEGIRAVILDSVLDVTYGGPADTLAGVEVAIDRFLDGCTDDPGCSATYGDLAATLEATRQRYNAAPAAATADLGNGPEQFVITGNDMMAGLFNALYDSALIPLLPGIITGLSNGDTAVLPALIQDAVPFATGFADSMTYAVNCADDAGLGRQEADRAAFEDPEPFELVIATVGLCPTDATPTPGQFNEPVTSDIPALVLAGSYDPITPAAGTRAVAERLANSTFVLVEPGGHGVNSFDDCLIGIGLAFLDAPSTPPDTGCVAAIPPVAFS